MNAPLLLTTVEVASLMCVSARTIERHCESGRLPAVVSMGNGGMGYRIAVADLPEPAQVKYWSVRVKALMQPERRAYLESLNLPEGIARAVAQRAGIPRKRNDAAPEPWTQDEFEEITTWFFKLHKHVQEQAGERARLLWDFEDMIVPAGMTKADAALVWCKERGISRSALYNWRSKVMHLPRQRWLYALVSEKRPGNGPQRIKADMDTQLWDYIKQSWLTQSKPALLPIYRRAQQMAEQRGLTLPSCKTISRRLAEIPLPARTLARDGAQALEEMYPPMRRDFTSLQIHEIWNADGRMADVHVRWPDGSVSRPIIVAWLELRTRTVVGWAMGKSESAHLVRQALAAGLERTHVIPRRAYLDNGRAFASKEITGGQASRYRFKVQPDEMQGVLTLLGTSVTWAKPYNGKAKPIESFWRTLAEAEKRPEFVGAYCGNKPENRPEEHDVENAVDVARYESVVREELEAYHARKHRGDGMDGRAPDQVYEALMEYAVVTQPSADQIRRCTLAVEQVALSRSGEVSVLGNRYGDDVTASLRRGVYTACYDPGDATKPVELWDGTTLVAKPPLLAKTGFADQSAAQDHSRAKNALKRSACEQLKAQLAMDTAADWTTPRAGLQEPGPALPRAKVAQPFRPGKGYKKSQTLGKKQTPEVSQTTKPGLSREEYLAALAKGEAMRWADEAGRRYG